LLFYSILDFVSKNSNATKEALGDQYNFFKKQSAVSLKKDKGVRELVEEMVNNDTNIK
jgi:hypothetical protein